MATQQMAVDSAERAYARSMLLAAPSRSPEIPESADAYGWLVGSWELDVWVYWAMDVRARGLKGRGALRLGAGRPCYSGRLDHAPPYATHRDSGQALEHVRHDPPSLGSFH